MCQDTAPVAVGPHEHVRLPLVLAEAVPLERAGRQPGCQEHGHISVSPHLDVGRGLQLTSTLTATSQPLSTIDLAQVAVKRAERSVSCFPSDLYHEAIGESDLRLLPKEHDSGGDRLSVLDGQVFVAQ